MDISKNKEKFKTGARLFELLNGNKDFEKLLESAGDDKELYITLLEERVRSLTMELKELRYDYEELDSEFNTFVMATMPVGTEH